MEAAREVAQLLERLRQLVRRLGEERVHVLARRVEELAHREAQRQRDRDEALLGSVVEVALQAPARLVGRADDADARLAQVGLRALVRDRLRREVGEAPQPRLGARSEPGRRPAATP